MKKPSQNRTIRLKTVSTWAILIILMVNLVSVSLSSYIISQGAVFEQIRDSLEQNSTVITLILDEVRKQMRSDLETIQIIFDLSEIYTINSGTRTQLESFIRQRSELDMIVFFDNNGEIIHQQQTGVIDLSHVAEHLKKHINEGKELQNYIWIPEDQLVVLIEKEQITEKTRGRVEGLVVAAHLINSNFSLIDRIQVESQSKGITFFVNDYVLASTEDDPDNVIENAVKAVLGGDNVVITDDRFFSFSDIIGFETVRIIDENASLNIAITFEDHIIKSLRDQFVIQVVQLGVILILMVVLLYFFLDQVIAYLFSGIFKFSSDILEGDFTSRFKRTAIEEIDELGHHIQDMSDSMIENHLILQEEINVRIEVEKNLKELNASLENIVQKRTKNIEEKNVELTQSLIELQQVKSRVESINAELEESLNQLQETQVQLVESEKMAALGNIIVGVSHELNTPLGVCLTTSTYSLQLIEELRETMILEEIEKHLIDQVDELKESTNINIRNLNKLCEIVDNFKNITESHSEEKRKTIYLKKVINQSLGQIKSTFSRRAIKFEVICNDQFIVESYPSVLIHVISHLIVNAIQHGIGEVSSGNVQIVVGQDFNETTINIVDDGRGIPDVQVPRIFEPYFTTEFGKGSSGLGLSNDYNLVKNRLGGSIRCISELGVGTTMIIVIPNEVDGFVE